MDETINQVAAIFGDWAQIAMEHLDRATIMREQLDSMALEQCFAEIEDELGVEIPPRDCQQMATIGNLVDFIDRQRGA